MFVPAHPIAQGARGAQKLRRPGTDNKSAIPWFCPLHSLLYAGCPTCADDPILEAAGATACPSQLPSHCLSTLGPVPPDSILGTTEPAPECCVSH